LFTWIPVASAAGEPATDLAAELMNSGKRLITAVVAVCVASVAEATAGTDASMSGAIANLLGDGELTVGGERILADDLLREIYAGETYQPFWTDDNDVRELLQLIRDAEEHGLSPHDYLIGPLNRVLADRSRNPSVEMQAEAEVLLTASLVRYAYHRRFGKVRAAELDPDVNFRREAFRDQPPGKTLREILAAPSIRQFLEVAAPSGPVYRALQQGLKDYRAIAAKGGWVTIADGPTLRVGDDDPRVVAIRARLAATGDLVEGAGRASSAFDEPLKQSVKVFQARHALAADGIVGRNTLATMNVPVAHRIDQLRASLERLRWVNQEAADTLVAVNIAGFRTAFFKDGELVWSTRAMVGKTYRRTPVFRGDIAYMEFNPTWTIPPGIIRNDTLPAVKRDPGYLVSKNIRVIDRNGKIVDPYSVDWHQYRSSVPYTLRQDPGPNNALGTVKFIFPNSHFVFLHDTPSRELFDRPERAFSSGCIRIEDPLRLAELLLDDAAKYPRSALEGIVNSQKTQRLHLKPKIPVVILYATASIDADGKVLFYRDIYDRDQRVLDALDGPVIIDLPARSGG
jgi:murein L,D-transpeptidase YcbB/YkuD